MKEVFNFLTKIGDLKGRDRRGWLLHNVEKPETTAEHTFHLALLVWILGRRKDKVDLDKMIKMALVHDLCEVYAKDLTPYDPLLSEDSEKNRKILEKWPEFTPEMKRKKEEDKRQMESEGLKKLTADLPQNLKEEIEELWLEYEGMVTPESRFVKQADKMVNFLQGMDYWRKEGKIRHDLWLRWIKEIIDEPILLDFLKEVEDEGIIKEIKE
jgi:putative hydrolase of HD superfamily